MRRGERRAGIGIADEEGKARAGIGIDDSGAPTVKLKDGDEEERAVLSVRRGAGQLELFDRHGERTHQSP